MKKESPFITGRRYTLGSGDGPYLCLGLRENGDAVLDKGGRDGLAVILSENRCFWTLLPEPEYLYILGTKDATRAVICRSKEEAEARAFKWFDETDEILGIMKVQIMEENDV